MCSSDGTKSTRIQLRSGQGYTAASPLLMLPLLICWEHITHTYDKKTNCSYCAGALRAFLHSPASCHPPETRCLLSSDCSHSLPPIISPSFRPGPPLSPCIFLSLLSASRFAASFQAGFKQLYGTSKCPSLFRLFRKADNDIPNPADLQLIALFHQPSTVILCTQNSSTSSPLAVPPHSSTAHIPSTRPQIFFFIINAHLHLRIPQMSRYPRHYAFSLSGFPLCRSSPHCWGLHSLLTGHRKHASLVRRWWKTTDSHSN